MTIMDNIYSLKLLWVFMYCPNCNKVRLSFFDKYNLVTWKEVRCSNCDVIWKVNNINYSLVLFFVVVCSYYVAGLDVNLFMKIVFIILMYFLAVFYCPIKKNTL